MKLKKLLKYIDWYQCIEIVRDDELLYSGEYMYCRLDPNEWKVSEEGGIEMVFDSFVIHVEEA